MQEARHAVRRVLEEAASVHTGRPETIPLVILRRPEADVRI
jgi:hypothetical protein